MRNERNTEAFEPPLPGALRRKPQRQEAQHMYSGTASLITHQMPQCTIELKKPAEDEELASIGVCLYESQVVVQQLIITAYGLAHAVAVAVARPPPPGPQGWQPVKTFVLDGDG
jgi:hypothetical protein